VLHIPGQPDQTFTGPGACHDFTVGPSADTTMITGNVTSNDQLHEVGVDRPHDDDAHGEHRYQRERRVQHR
jgi:hypothetical protein